MPIISFVLNVPSSTIVIRPAKLSEMCVNNSGLLDPVTRKRPGVSRSSSIALRRALKSGGSS